MAHALHTHIDGNLAGCPRCHFNNTGHAKFCGSCGLDFNAANLCSFCHSLIQASARFCHCCGNHAASKSTTPGIDARRLRPQLPFLARFCRSFFLSTNRFLVGLIRQTLFLVKLILVTILIYELFVLLPIIRTPNLVRIELLNQKKEIHNAWAGLLAINDTVKTELIDLGNQRIDASSKESAKSAFDSRHKASKKNNAEANNSL